MMLAAFMTELALHSMGRTKHFHALCETDRDLPDAVQLLTPCTAGNGRLHVLDLGRFALTLFRTPGGKGVRVYLDLAKTAGWPHIRRWALQEPMADERSLVRLEREIRKAGIAVLSTASDAGARRLPPRNAPGPHDCLHKLRRTAPRPHGRALPGLRRTLPL